MSLNSIDENAAEAVQHHFQRIANGWPRWRAVRTGDHADPWVIAYARALNGVVVSEEQPGGNEVKIPDVCRALRVAHINLLGLFRDEGFGG